MRLFQVRTLPVTLLIAGVFAFGGVVAYGQRPQGGGAAGPMLVDFSATLADGRPVTDLTAADLSIKIGGKVRSISDLTLKKFAAPASGAPAAATAAAPAASGGATAPYFTNEATAAPAPAAPAGATGRYYLIVVDTESLSPGTEAQMKTAIEGLLKDLTPADHVALSTAPHDTAQIGFGSSLAAVRQAVAGLRGQKAVISNSDDRDAVAYCRTSDTLNLLKALMQMAPGGDTPMNVILIDGGLMTAGQASSKASTGTSCQVVADQYNSLAAATSGGRANVFVVQGDSGAGSNDPGLNNVAGVTGAGAVMKVTNEGFAPRVLAESSNYWVATLAPDPSDKPNQSQRLELKTTKEGVTIHTRPEAMLSHAGNAPGAAPAAAGKAGTAPADMAKSTASFSDLQLRAYAFAQRGTGDKMNVIVQAEPVDPSVKLSAMKIGFFDAAGKGATLDPASAITTYPITTLIPVGVGQYRIRVAATDGTKGGAVDVKLDTTPIPAGPFKLSGIMLTVKTPDGKFVPRLQASKGDTVVAMFELYGVIPPAARMKVGFEIAKSDTGEAIKSFNAGGQPTAEPDKVQILGEIPMSTLEPGDYVIRGVVALEGAGEGKTIRTLRIK